MTRAFAPAPLLQSLPLERGEGIWMGAAYMTAMHFNSMAMGVGSAVTPTVVRLG